MMTFYNKTFDEIRMGDSAELTRILTKSDIKILAILSGDVNALHFDPEYAKHTLFHHIVGHGMWSALLISTLLGTQLPGPGAIYLNQTMKFTRPVFIGDEITAKITVIKKYVRKPVIILQCKCINQYEKLVLSGLAKVLVPIKKLQYRKMKLPKLV